jgi:hypothetical protein
MIMLLGAGHIDSIREKILRELQQPLRNREQK